MKTNAHLIGADVSSPYDWEAVEYVGTDAERDPRHTTPAATVLRAAAGYAEHLVALRAQRVRYLLHVSLEIHPIDVDTWGTEHVMRIGVD